MKAWRRLRTDGRRVWERALPFPDLSAFTRLCHASGQVRPTPLLLRYRAGDYDCLHQDLYGDLHFPFQVAVLLSEPEVDFDGGEFVLTEQRPRMQSRAHVVPLRMGDAVVFAVNEAPRAGTRGTYRVKMRHGVSEIRRASASRSASYFTTRVSRVRRCSLMEQKNQKWALGSGSLGRSISQA